MRYFSFIFPTYVPSTNENIGAIHHNHKNHKASKISKVSSDPSEVTMSILDGLHFTESLRAVAELETFLKVEL